MKHGPIKQTKPRSSMFSDAMIIYRKELRNVIKDRRTLFATLILPLVLMPAIFIGMNAVMSRQEAQAQEQVYSLEIRNNDDPRLQGELSKQLNFELTQAPSPGSLVIEFPEGYRVGDEADVTIYYDSTSQALSFASRQIISALQGYDQVLANQTLLSVGLDLDSLYTIRTFRVDTAPEESQGTEFLVMMIPYLIIIYTFAGSMSVGIDTTAGEKERGSIAIILVNQVSRSSIALGKVLYVLSAGIASSLMTFAGLLIAFSTTGGMFTDGTDFTGFSIPSLVTLFFALAFTSMLAASIIVLLGSLAKTAKEATSYVMPIYIIVVLTGVLTMSFDPATQPLLFLVPFVNSIFLMKGAILGTSTILQLLLTVISLSVVIGVLITGTSRLYNSEKILESAVN